jgi:hypothetical protein
MVRVTPLPERWPKPGRVVESRAVSELPLATRTQIPALSPGTSVSRRQHLAGRNPQNISVNGARVTQNDFELS